MRPRAAASVSYFNPFTICFMSHLLLLLRPGHHRGGCRREGLHLLTAWLRSPAHSRSHGSGGSGCHGSAVNSSSSSE